MDGGGTFSLTEAPEQPLPVTNQEEKELRRVFNMLSDYNRKVRVQIEIGELQNLLSGGKQRLTSAQAEGQVVINLERFENNAEACHKRIDELAWELENIAQNPHKKVSIADVSEMLRRLRHGKVSMLSKASSRVDPSWNGIDNHVPNWSALA
jgi:hypothetical protein